MTSPRRYLALLGAFFVLPFGLAACGGGVPGNAVVSIGGDTIKKTAFDHWLKILAVTQAQQTGQSSDVVVPDPPNFTKCIAAKQKVKPAKGQPKPTVKTLKSQCQTEYNGLRDQVMQFFINSAWTEGEAADQGVKVTDAAVKKEFDQLRKQSFPQDTAYKQFLKSYGYTQEDLLYQVKIRQLSQKLRDKILKGTDKVTDAQIAAYYNKNKENFAQPEKRDLRIVLTKSKAKAEAAKKAIENGESWKAVAKRYSIDQGSKANGGLLTGVPKGQQEKALDDATFKAAKGKVEGPIKTQFGYYVFEVVKVTPGTQQSLAQAKESIKQLLISQNQQKKSQDFGKAFEKKWKDRTDCQKGYVIASCKNAPKQSTTATTGAVTQNAPPADATATTAK